MIATAAFSWGFTLWFAALAGASVVGLARAGRTPDGLSYAAHAIMAGVMALMPWGWSAVVPQAIWIAVFGAFALWYLSIAISRPGTRIAPGGGHHATGALLWYHGAMMGAMVWMSVLVLLAASGGAGVGAHHELAMGPGGGVGGAGAQGVADASVLANAETAAPWQQPGWAVAVTWVFVALFAVAVGWFVARLLTLRAGARAAEDAVVVGDAMSGVGRGIRPALPPAAEATLSLAMAAGMGASFVLML